MDVTLQWSTKVERFRSVKPFADFMQKMLNRLLVGHYRYAHEKTGIANREPKRFVKRARMELSAYQKSGNVEHLINAANYCALEFAAPEHPKAVYDPYADSATRGRV